LKPGELDENNLRAQGTTLKPSKEQLYRMMTRDKSYSYITFKNNFNNWNDPLRAFSPNEPMPFFPISFYNKINLGKENGIAEIFDGFELKNKTRSYMS
jgi:hypothetical protein